MKHRITALFLALCLVAAMIPGVAAFGLPENAQVSPSGLMTSRMLDSYGATSLAPGAELTPMADPSDYAELIPCLSYDQLTVVAGSTVEVQCLYWVGQTLTQNMGFFILNSQDQEVKAASDYGPLYQPQANSYYITSVDIDTKAFGMGQGNYKVYFYIADGDDELVDGFYLDLQVLGSAVAPKGISFADIRDESMASVSTINVAKGYGDWTPYFLNLSPANATVSRAASYTSSDASVLDVASWGGYLALSAIQYGTVKVTGSMAGMTTQVTVNICTDENGHSLTDVVSKQPTCTEEGAKVSRCSKCGYTGATVAIPATGHTWNEGVVTKEETPDAYGEKLYTCTVCGATETRPYHTCPGAGFVDMPKDTNWAHKGIDYCLKSGLMVGVDETHFSPSTSVTRGQLVTILWRQAGSPAPQGEAPFEDLSLKYYRQAIAWAAETGIAKGITETTFRPNDPVTREQFAAFMYRFAQFQGKDVTARADLGSFPDNGKLSNYAKDPMSWAVAAGLISGVGDNGVSYLQPKSSATRAQTATILMRYCKEQ